MSLAREDGVQQPVQPWARQGVVRAVAPQQPLHRAHCDGDRQKQGIEIEDMLDHEPRAPGGLGQAFPCVATEVVVPDIVLRLHPWQSRYRHDQAALRLQPLPQGLQRTQIVLDMLQDVEKPNQVVPLRLEGDRVG